MHNDQDEDKINTLAFINFLLVKILPTLIMIRQYFPSKFCAIYGITSFTKYYTDNLLWDGIVCTNSNDACCDYFGQPWFT